MSKVIIKPNPEITPIVNYERHTEDAVNGKIVPNFVKANALTRAPNTKFSIMPILSAKLGALQTGGMLDMIPNPYKELTTYRSEAFRNALEGQDEVLRQYVLEYKHGKPFNYYTNQIDHNSYRRNFKDKLSDIPYMQTRAARLDLNDGATVLDMDNPVHEVLFYIAQGHKLIANSYSELDHNTRFYISDEQAEAAELQKNKRIRDLATAHLVELSGFGNKVLVKFCKALNLPRGPKLGMTDEQAYILLSDLFKGSEDGIRGFEQLYAIFKDPGRKREFEARALLSDLIDTDIFYVKGNSYFWSQPTDEDGVTPEPIEFVRKSEAVQFLTEKKNQEEHEIINRQLAAKLRI
jgi:hypothetical protein